jgi:hypothetical protein
MIGVAAGYLTKSISSLAGCQQILTCWTRCASPLWSPLYIIPLHIVTDPPPPNKYLTRFGFSEAW